LAQSGHSSALHQCPLSGGIADINSRQSAFDPKQTSADYEQRLGWRRKRKARA
jgi:hypothetical protein